MGLLHGGATNNISAIANIGSSSTAPISLYDYTFSDVIHGCSLRL
jgi:hypothetical protein